MMGDTHDDDKQSVRLEKLLMHFFNILFPINNSSRLTKEHIATILSIYYRIDSE